MERTVINQWNRNRKRLVKYFRQDIPDDVTKFHLYGRPVYKWMDYVVEVLLKVVINVGKESMDMRFLKVVHFCDRQIIYSNTLYVFETRGCDFWYIRTIIGTIDTVSTPPWKNKEYYVKFAMYCSLMYIQQLRPLKNTCGIRVISLDKIRMSESYRSGVESSLTKVMWEELAPVADSLPSESAAELKRLFLTQDDEEVSCWNRLDYAMDEVEPNDSKGKMILDILLRNFCSGFLVIFPLPIYELNYENYQLLTEPLSWREILNNHMDWKIRARRSIVYGKTLDEIYSKCGDYVDVFIEMSSDEEWKQGQF